MKAILVIDMPNSCYECPLYNDEYDSCGYYGTKAIKDRCPLKPLPKKRELKSMEYLEHFRLGHVGTYEQKAYSIGWNDCLKEIEE